MASSSARPQARRLFLFGLSGAMLALAGCQTGSRPALPAPGEAGSTPLPPPTAEAPRNGVALLVPLAGQDGMVGQSIANAANLALADTGEKSLRLTVYDTAGPGGAAGAAQRALADGNRLFLGPLLAEDVRAAAPLARKASVPLIAFSNDESVAGNGVYLMGFTPAQSIERVVGYARAQGKSRFAGLTPSGVYGQRATQALLAATKRQGGSVAALESYNRTPASVRGAAGKLKARGGYDALLLADGGAIAAAAASAAGPGAQLIGTELWASDRALGKTAALRGGWFAAAPDAQFERLVTRYRARYGKTPYRIASLGYDTVLLAVRNARNWPIGRPFPARALVERDGFAGVDGIFRFGRDGIAERALEVRKVTAAGSEVISPAARAFAD